MSADEQDEHRIPGGIHDTGDLRRIWDALERIAGRIDGASPDPSVGGAGCEHADGAATGASTGHEVDEGSPA